MDDGCLQVKIPHKSLGGEKSPGCLKVEHFRNRLMQFKGKGIIFPSAQHMEAESHLEQEIVCLLQTVEVIGSNYGAQCMPPPYLKCNAPDPENSMDVSQSTTTLFYI